MKMTRSKAEKYYRDKWKEHLRTTYSLISFVDYCKIFKGIIVVEDSEADEYTC